MSVAEARALLASASEELGTTEVTAALIIGLVSLVALWLVKWLVSLALQRQPASPHSRARRCGGAASPGL